MRLPNIDTIGKITPGSFEETYGSIGKCVKCGKHVRTQVWEDRREYKDENGNPIHRECK